MGDFVRTLRERLGLTQQQFAERFKMSYGAIQGYESGRSPSRARIETLKSIAVDTGHADLISMLSGELPPTPPPTTPAEKQRWLNMLAAILDSGDKDAIPAVQSNLVTFDALIQARKELAKRRKGVTHTPQKRSSTPP
jgi:transcriptional regulator with XRE-family HTH domain